MLDGEACEMQCYLVNCDGGLGRSTVIDLTAKGDNKFRQVDHRTIDFIIIRNKKYVLKKGGKKAVADEEMDDGKKKEPKWDYSKLAAGTWFSGTRYFRSVEEQKGQIKMRSEANDVVVSRDIVETQMHNSEVFSSEEKLSMTKVAELLEQARTTCFTVTFTTKVDKDYVSDKLAKLKDSELKAPSKAIASDLIKGKQTTLVGRLSKADGKLGRSLVIDLPTQGYRLVDHRTIESLIIRDVKYIVK